MSPELIGREEEPMPRILEQGRRRILELLDDDVEIVMSVRQWAQVANLGYSTAKRLMASGDGPKKTRLTSGIALLWGGQASVRSRSHAAWLLAVMPMRCIGAVKVSKVSVATRVSPKP